LSFPARSPLPERELQDQELVEREPAPCDEEALDVVREVHLPERRGDVWQTVALADRRRQWLGDLTDQTRAARAALDRRVQPASHLTGLMPSVSG